MFEFWMDGMDGMEQKMEHYFAAKAELRRFYKVGLIIKRLKVDNYLRSKIVSKSTFVC